MKYSTDQEAFWAGDFGDEYIGRNRESVHFASRLHMLSNALRRAGTFQSAIEFGPNIGLNISALRNLAPDASLSAVEINPQAVSVLSRIADLDVREGSILEGHQGVQRELSLASGLLIHIDPDSLHLPYDTLYAASFRLILIAEYYNPSPVMIPYRGEDHRLYKRDFAGEMLDRFRDLELLDYGFQYHRDPAFPADDLTWFLMERRRVDDAESQD